MPCNPDALVMGYALKLAGETIPLTRYVDPAHLNIQYRYFGRQGGGEDAAVIMLSADGRIIPFETMNMFYRDEKEVYMKELKIEKFLNH